MKKQSQEIVSFAEVVTMIRQAHCRTISFANSAMVDLYWRVGRYVSQKISTSEWGKGVVAQLSAYIANKHPDIKGFSDKNIWRMKQFYETYSVADEKLSTLLREISWSNNVTVISRAKTVEERLFYINLCIHDRLSNRELNRQIDSCLFERSHIESVKLSPVLRELQCLVAFELKTEKFKPEHLGQMNFYLEALDRDVKKPKENPSIGILLCKDKDDEVVEYALNRSLSPTMVAEYKLYMPNKDLLQQKLKEISA